MLNNESKASCSFCSLCTIHDSKHAISSCRQPPEEIQRHRRKLVAEPRVSQHIDSSEKCDNLERSDIEYNGSNQTENHKEGSGSWISPAEQRLQPLPLSGQITNHSLYPPSNASKSFFSYLAFFQEGNDPVSCARVLWD